MSLALLHTMLLRTLSNPDLTAKGSTLTWEEVDQRIVIAYNAIKEIAGAEVPGISPYNPATEYSNTTPDYVTYDGNTWEYINAIPSTGTAPGTDASTWSLASSGIFVHAQNSDTILADGTADEVTAAEIRTFIDGDPEQVAKDYADSLVVGLWDDRGNYDASVNTFPDSGGSALSPAGAVLKGDIWTVSVGGTLGGNVVAAGDTVRALIDTPGQTSSNWAIAENNIGYVPLNSDGGTMSGAINMDGNNLTNVGNFIFATGGQIISEDLSATLSSIAGGFLLNGTTRLNSLTGSRVLELDASKNIISVAKQDGYNLALGTTAGTVLEGSNDALYAKLAGTNVFEEPANFDSDTDGTHIFGRAKIGSPTTDVAYFAHFDHLSTTNYSVQQNAAGATTINTVTGQAIAFRINNVNYAYINASSGAVFTSTCPVQIQSSSSTALLVTGGLSVGGDITKSGSRVVSSRKTGWAVASGTATRTTFDTTTVTTEQLAERVKALIDDLHATAGHGLIGT